MAARKNTDERNDAAKGEIQVEKPGTSEEQADGPVTRRVEDEVPRGPVNPPEPEAATQPEPAPQPENPPEPDDDAEPVDNRTRDGLQVPVNPPEAEAE